MYNESLTNADLPGAEPLKNRYINDGGFLNKRDGRLVHEIVDYEDEWNWRDKNGKSLWTENLEYYYSFKFHGWETEFDSNVHLISIRKYDYLFSKKIPKEEVRFEYEENSDNLIHVVRKENNFDDKNQCVSETEEKFFKYDGGAVVGEKHIGENREHDEGSYEKIYEYDASGNLIYEKCAYQDSSENNYAISYAYDSKNNLVHKKIGFEYASEYNFEEFSEYDANGNLVHSKIDDYEEWNEYDEKGNLIYSKRTHDDPADDYEEWSEYNESGNRIHLKHRTDDPGNNYDEWDEYDESGKRVHSKVLFECASENNFEVLHKYDKDGNLIEEKWVGDDGEIKDYLSSACYEYSASAKLIHKTCANGNEQRWDEEGHLLYLKSVFDGGDYEEKTWDSYGHLLHFKLSSPLGSKEGKWDSQGRLCYQYLDRKEKCFEYEPDGNLIHCHFKDDESGEESNWVQNDEGKII